MTFNGLNLFGTQQGYRGPTISYRTQDEELPGVDGVRSYRLGKSTRNWLLRGRLTSTTLAGLTNLIQAGQALNNGAVYTFVDLGGISWTNCQMTVFEPLEPPQPCFTGAGSSFTVRIQAAIRQLAP